MRISLLLAFAVLPLAVGCLADPVNEALAGKDPQPPVRILPGAPPITQRDMIIKGVAMMGGKIQIDAESLDRPVTSADLHSIRSASEVLAALGPLTRCGSLNLFDTKVTDADMERLRGLIHLNTLNLAGTAITDTGLANLRGLPNLRDLVLNHTRIGDAGMQTIATLPNLRILELGGTQVTDEGLRDVANVKMIEKLVLGGRGITDRGMEHLKRLRYLRKLTLAGTRVTNAGVADLRAASPFIFFVR